MFSFKENNNNELNKLDITKLDVFSVSWVILDLFYQNLYKKNFTLN